MHFTCICVNLSRFKMIITRGYIKDMLDLLRFIKA